MAEGMLLLRHQVDFQGDRYVVAGGIVKCDPEVLAINFRSGGNAATGGLQCFNRSCRARDVKSHGLVTPWMVRLPAIFVAPPSFHIFVD